MTIRRASPLLLALLAAVCFGASTPCAKLLLGSIDPIPLAALLYLGSGVILALYLGITRRCMPAARAEARLTRADLPWLLGAILVGGVAAPVVLLLSLRQTPAATASLLLNFEGVATTLIAAVVFREHIGARVWWAILLVTAACAVLSVETHGTWGISLGAFGVLATCICWGIDNNVTRQISDKDPLTIVMMKGLCAGSFSLGLALLLHRPFPGVLPGLWAALLGSVGYGLSIVLFIFALRSLGAARTSGLFASAPFVGALLSFFLLHEAPGWQFLLAAPLLLLGVLLLLREPHAHPHQHTPTAHEHRHRHDDAHHAHHAPHEGVAPEACHTHPHAHAPLVHTHPHTPDFHHRHAHE